MNEYPVCVFVLGFTANTLYSDLITWPYIYRDLNAQ